MAETAELLMHEDWLRYFRVLARRVDEPPFINVNQIVGGGQPLTRVNDTNVAVSLTGEPLTALLKPVTLTMDWIGTLAAGRLNANVVQSVVNNTNVTGSIAAQTLTLDWTGTLALIRGGTAADLSATGGAGQYLKQVSNGAAITVGTIPASEIASGAALTKADDTNVTLTLGGTPGTALLVAASITAGWAGTLAPARGGLGLSVSGIAKGGLVTGTGAGTFGITTVGADGLVLAANAAAPGGVAWTAVAGSGTVTGSGTAGTLAKFTSASAIGDSLLTEASTAITLAGRLVIAGNHYANVDASMAKAAAYGLILQAATGSPYDFGLLTAGGGDDIMRVPVGTANVQFPTGTVTFGAGTPRYVFSGLQLFGYNGTQKFLGHASGINDVYSGGTSFRVLNAAETVVLLSVTDAGAVNIPAGSLTWGGGATIASSSNMALLTGALFTGALSITNETAAYLSFVDLTDGVAGYVGPAPHIITGGTMDYLGVRGEVGIDFSIAGTKVWGVNAAGDWLFGASAHIADSSGTPTIASGFGTSPSIAGNDYAFTVTVGTGGVATSGIVNFGHTFTNTPVGTMTCSVVGFTSISAISTTAVTLNFFDNVGGALPSGSKIYVHCRGY